MIIRIARARDTLKVEAYVRGAFAVHAPDGTPLELMKADGWYTVTHRNTGYAVGGVRGKQTALDLAQRLNAILPEGDFTAGDFETEKYLGWARQAKPMVDQAKEL